MNSRQLEKLGVPAHCLAQAMRGIQSAVQADGVRGKDLKGLIKDILAQPGAHLEDLHFGEFARELVAESQFTPAEPISYQTWGDDIDVAAHIQMQQACAVPSARGAALMPDAHLGYGLPIGGVLACENAVIPYAVGVDIACRMKLSILDTPVDTLDSRFDHYRRHSKGVRDSVSARCMRHQRAIRCSTRIGASPASRARTRTRPGSSLEPRAPAITSSNSAS